MNLNIFLKRFKDKREIISKFRKEAASSIELAKSLKDLDVDFNSSRIEFNKLIRKGIIKKFSSDNLYYLDERQLLQENMNRVKWGIIFLFFLLGFLFLLLSKPQT